MIWIDIAIDADVATVDGDIDVAVNIALMNDVNLDNIYKIFSLHLLLMSQLYN